MERTIITTAKIQPEIYEKIRNGEKKYEVRDEEYGISWINPTAIRYVDQNGKELGIYRVSEFKTICYIDLPKSIWLMIADITEQKFDELFDVRLPEQYLYIAKIGEPVTDISQLFEDKQ